MFRVLMVARASSDVKTGPTGFSILKILAITFETALTLPTMIAP